MKKSKEELLAMSHEELADYTMTLQAYYLIASEASNKRLQALENIKEQYQAFGKIINHSLA